MAYRLPSGLLHRYHLVIASVYLFNEYRGYCELERLYNALVEKFPHEVEFLLAVRKHLNDEKKHYRLFKKYFVSRNELPIRITTSDGYIDRFVRLIFHRNLDSLDVSAIVESNEELFRLCRLVMITEFRGMKQVESLLRSRLVNRSEDLIKIFRVIERDEPTHCLPYQIWLESHNKAAVGIREKIMDIWIHYSLIFYRLPLLFLNPFQKRVIELP